MPNSGPKIFWKVFIYRVLWTMNFLSGVWAPTLFGHAKFEVKNILESFGLQGALDSEFFRGCVQALSFFGHTKFQVKNF